MFGGCLFFVHSWPMQGLFSKLDWRECVLPFQVFILCDGLHRRVVKPHNLANAHGKKPDTRRSNPLWDAPFAYKKAISNPLRDSNPAAQIGTTHSVHHWQYHRTGRNGPPCPIQTTEVFRIITCSCMSLFKRLGEISDAIAHAAGDGMLVVYREKLRPVGKVSNRPRVGAPLAPVE